MIELDPGYWEPASDEPDLDDEPDVDDPYEDDRASVDRDPPDGNIGGDPIFPDPGADPDPLEELDRAPAGHGFERAHLFGSGLFDYGESWA